MSTRHREDAEKLLEKVKVIINSPILHSDLARDLIEMQLCLAYNDGKLEAYADIRKTFDEIDEGDVKYHEEMKRRHSL